LLPLLDSTEFNSPYLKIFPYWDAVKRYIFGICEKGRFPLFKIFFMRENPCPFASMPPK
jgi:hypothetical protein